MAQKYVRQGATFNGDGTSSALAAVDGGVGAWNDLWGIFTGAAPAFGVIANGDIINIRAQTEAGGNLTHTLIANTNFGRSGATTTLPIKWVVDDGTIWTGITGGVDISSTTSVTFTFLGYNHFYGASGTRNFTLSCQNISNRSTTIQNGAVLKNFVLDYSNGGIYGSKVILGSSTQNIVELSNVLISMDKWYLSIIGMGNYNNNVFNDVDIEIKAAGGAEPDPIISGGNYGAKLDWNGGKIYGAGIASYAGYLYKPVPSSGSIIMQNVEVPQGLTLLPPSLVVNGGARVYATGMDSKMAMAYVTKNSTYDSRDDGNYPTLNAKLPNSTSTPWSIKLYSHINEDAGAVIIPISKLWNQTAKTLTVTSNFLIDTALDLPTDANVWIEYSYIEDGTNNRVVGSTRDIRSNIAVPTSTALWSATTYGAQSYTKRELTFITPTAVKQDSVIDIKWRTSIKAPSSNLFFFIDPEIVAV